MVFTKLIVNLRGSIFQMRLKHVSKYPDTLLGKIAGLIARHEDDRHSLENMIEDILELSEDLESVSVNDNALEVELNRTPVLFHYILDLYVRGGAMHLPTAFCAKLVHDEMRFWGVSERKLVTCCWAKLREEQEKQVTLQRVQREWGVSDEDGGQVHYPFNTTNASIKMILEDHQSCRKAMVSLMHHSKLLKLQTSKMTRQLLVCNPCPYVPSRHTYNTRTFYVTDWSLT
jgi:hypothetical protein